MRILMLALAAVVFGGCESGGSQGGFVWVQKQDGAKSCDPASGVPLDKGASFLESSGVRVLESRKGDDGKMRAQMCGMPTGTSNQYKIAIKDKVNAEAVGFQLMPENPSH